MKVARLMPAIAVVFFLCAAGQLRAQEVTFEGKTLTQWVAELRDGDWEQRIMAAWALGEIGAAAAPAVPVLVEAVGDEDVSVRMYSAHALGAIGQGTEAVRAALQQALNDPDEDVRAQAAWALQQLAATGAEPPTVPPAVTPTPAPVPPQPGEGPPTGLPAVAPAPVERAPSEEEARLAVEGMLRQSFSLGLLDEAGNQLNPNVPEDAISLRPADLDAHARLIVNGNFRTVGEVVGFLARLGVSLSSTGGVITVEDLLPDLQRYVEWCYANPDDPRTGLGMLLAAGTGLTPPDVPPRMSGETQITPLAALMLLADVLIGVPEHLQLQGSAPAQPAPTLLAWAGGAIGPLTAVGGAVASDATTLERIKGLVTLVETVEKARFTTPDLRWRLLQMIVHAFETYNRMAVCIVQVDPASLTQGPPTRLAKLERRHDQVGLGATTVSANGSPVQSGVHLFEYEIRLTGGDDPSGTGVPLYEDADATLSPVAGHYTVTSSGRHLLATDRAPRLFFLTAEKVECEEPRLAMLVVSATIPEFDVEQLLKDYWLQVSVSNMSWAETKQLLGTDMISDLRPTPALCRVWFGRPPGPDLVIAEARGSYRQAGAGRYQVHSVITVRNAGDEPTDPQGIIEVKLSYLPRRAALSYPHPGGKRGAGALAPGETWQVDAGWLSFEPPGEPELGLATVYYTPTADQPKETDSENNGAQFRLSEATPEAETPEQVAETRPEPGTAAAMPPSLRAADLLGRRTIGGDMFLNTRVHTNGKQVSGAFWFWDRRPQHREQGFERIDIYANFDGEVYEWNWSHEEEMAQAVERAEGQVVVGNFDVTGEWRGEKWVPRGTEIETEVVTGQVRVTGYVAETHNGAYVAHGRVCFSHAGQEEFDWVASSGAWDEELAAARKRMGADFKMADFPWRIPDWAK
jgi:hypothetical protein